jgi:methyl-accepting chemotaxis protein
MMVSEASKGVNDVAEKNTNIVALTGSTQSMTKENTDYASGLKEIVDKFKLQ